MGDFVFNIAKGRVAEYANRVNANDPAPSAIIAVVLKSTGLESDATLKDYDTLSAILAAANDEATNTGYSRTTITSLTITTDDTNDRVDVDCADLTYTSVQATGGAWGKVLFCYDPDTGAGTDADIIPLTAHDVTITPDGSNITIQLNSAGFFRAA